MNKRKAFTLVELIVVIFSVTLLLLVMLPGLRTVRKHSKQAVCTAHLRSIGQAVHDFVEENFDRIAKAPNWSFWDNQWSIEYFGDTNPYYEYQPEHLLSSNPDLEPKDPYSYAYWGVAYKDYIASRKIFHCPSMTWVDDWREQGLPYGPPLQPYLKNTCYAINRGYVAGSKFSSFPNPSETIFAQDHIESGIEGIGNDMFCANSEGINLAQWRDGGPGGLWPVDEPVDECFRHQKSANILWLDGHVSVIPETDGITPYYVPQVWYNPFIND